MLVGTRSSYTFYLPYNKRIISFIILLRKKEKNEKKKYARNRRRMFILNTIQDSIRKYIRDYVLTGDFGRLRKLIIIYYDYYDSLSSRTP